MAVERLFRRGDQCRVIGKPKIIVRTHVEQAFATRNRNVRVLRTRDDALGFEKTLRFNFFERLRNLFIKLGDHS
jgi:hypothetical protein